MTYTNGDQYDGEWEEGLKSGYGTYLSANGSCYIGEWKHDDYNG